MVTSQAAYCQVGDVLNRLYSGQGGVSPPVDPVRDAFISDLILSCSRRWEQVTGRPLNGYVPLYEPRLFSGRGSQWIDVDDFGALGQVEIDTTQGRQPTWTDVTTDWMAVGNNPSLFRGRVLPEKYWPKNRLFRMSTFYVDAYQYGNVRIHAVWGTVQPNTLASVPLTQVAVTSSTLSGLVASLPVVPLQSVVAGLTVLYIAGVAFTVTAVGAPQGASSVPVSPVTLTTPIPSGAVVNAGAFPPYNLSPVSLGALQPTDADGNTLGGWWTTPGDVVDTIARWAAYTYKASQAAYSDMLGSGQTASAGYGKAVPRFVQDLADYYSQKRLHMAMITPDGVDIADEKVYGQVQGSPGTTSRWAGWQTTDRGF